MVNALVIMAQLQAQQTAKQGEQRLASKTGRVEGRQEGEAGLLQRQLTRKFGPLPEHLRQRIQSATPTQLETWSLNILDAITLDGVFEE